MTAVASVMSELHVPFSSPASTSLSELATLQRVAMAVQSRARKRVVTRSPGGSAARVLGRGLDFAEVREYRPGDDVRMIDWNVTARTGSAHTKLFVEERERPCLITIDYRAGMRFGTRGMYKSVLAARLGAILGWCAVANNDRVGGVVSTDDRMHVARPQSGRRGLFELFRGLDIAQRAVPGTTTTEEMRQDLLRLKKLASSGSSICVISDFATMGESVESIYSAILATCEVTAIMVSDPVEAQLPPPGDYVLSHSGRRLAISTNDDRTRAFYETRFEQRKESLKQFFSRRGGQFVSVSTQDDLITSATRVLTLSAGH